MIGQVVKAHSSHFTVYSCGKTEKCTARGLIKHNNANIVCGDLVEFGNGVIQKVLPRKNFFVRPSASNIDAVVIVISPEPKPDFYLVDKLCINAIKEDCEIFFVINKTDISDDLFQFVKSEYQYCSDNFYKISAKDNIGISSVKDALKNKLCILAGQSAVGKTSLINAMFGVSAKTGDLSEKIMRGKHTTTHSELYMMDDISIIDSPGFAAIDADVTLDVLPECYPEYFRLSPDCKFRGCSHINEPDCRVKDTVERGKLSKSRYDRYTEIYKELSQRRKIYE